MFTRTSTVKKIAITCTENRDTVVETRKAVSELAFLFLTPDKYLSATCRNSRRSRDQDTNIGSLGDL